ncbi:uncharacterized protein LOC126987906 [Eriocheir sinensis]|uniref:uncharacterized protein LOC126987906 n=1 Tax=Eriocheir sinensis TaxID=95602 RepID=UPI0021C79A12|nr:uncharacterized protein LOC126987906 [Eriocheir sinensis]XP_050701440.1 uncharacterized protein LOC126987906 [Eriocheir sinensis]XP_050701441.1 uncharacterized protein LOC126987906 [Eriocheir sinensis]XP_050701442.1 uncharacterized protein LOC126987906 [Eriocheir sinensis]XP_050701443.1 uncharacterized protein LOC126987906 [Eriocheir sinensis]XP_050701444.1 uncharacterized protein LOC126987906 [Eriocheir sinensis]
MSGPGGGSAPLSPTRPAPRLPLGLPRPPSASRPQQPSLQHQVGELEAKAASMRTVLSQLVDADKDVDTEGTVGGEGGVLLSSACDSPPPLPSLIFDAPPMSHVTPALLGSNSDLTHPHMYRCGSPHPLTANTTLSGLVFNNNFEFPNDNNNTTTNDFIENHDLPDCNSNTEYCPGELRYPSPHTSRPVSRASSHASLPASTASHVPRRSQSSHTQPRGNRRYLRQTRSASRGSRQGSGGSLNLPGGLSTSSLNLDSQEDIATLILTLRKERSRLLQEIEAEEEERAWFYSQLENLNQQLRRSSTDNVSTPLNPHCRVPIRCTL